jgi:hypothetical protein
LFLRHRVGSSWLLKYTSSRILVGNPSDGCTQTQAQKALGLFSAGGPGLPDEVLPYSIFRKTVATVEVGEKCR